MQLHNVVFSTPINTHLSSADTLPEYVHSHWLAIYVYIYVRGFALWMTAFVSTKTEQLHILAIPW